MEKKQLLMLLPLHEHTSLKKLAADKDTTMSKLVRSLIQDELKRVQLIDERTEETRNWLAKKKAETKSLRDQNPIKI